MALIIVERVFETPAVLASLQADEDAHGWCLSENGVTFLRTYFSIDRHRMCCLYEAPDAEAVRRTQRTAGLPFARIWPGISLAELTGSHGGAPTKGQTVVVAERSFPPGTDLVRIRAMVAESRWCLDENGIDAIDSYLMADMAGSICTFTAPDAESVRRASRTTGVPLTRAWAATLHDAGGA